MWTLLGILARGPRVSVIHFFLAKMTWWLHAGNRCPKQRQLNHQRQEWGKCCCCCFVLWQLENQLVLLLISSGSSIFLLPEHVYCVLLIFFQLQFGQDLCWLCFMYFSGDSRLSRGVLFFSGGVCFHAYIKNKRSWRSCKVLIRVFQQVLCQVLYENKCALL